MLETVDVALVGPARRVAAVEHRLVLHDDALVPQRVLELLRLAERTVGPVRERAVLAQVPPRDDLRHLHEVVGEQPRLPHDVLQPHRRVLDADAAERDRVEVRAQSAVVRAAEVEEHHASASRTARPSSREPARGTCCCRRSRRAPGRSTPSSWRRTRGSARSRRRRASTRRSPSRISPDVVATSSSTVSKWCAVIVGQGPRA